MVERREPNYASSYHPSCASSPAARRSDVKLPDPDPKTLQKYHFSMMVFWALNVPPFVAAFFILSRNTFELLVLIYIGVVSIYANFAAHFAGWDAARAEDS